MIRRFLYGLLLVAACLSFRIDPCHADTTRKQIIIGILPCSDVELSFKKFHPLIMYLKARTGLDIGTVLPKSFEEFEWAIKNRDIDFAFQEPHTYVFLADQYNKNALIRALTWNGNAYQYGLIIVLKNSEINKMGDLKGKTVMFGPKFSTTKWFASKMFFKENGIDINKDLRSYLNGGCCEDIAFNVYLKAVDAGVVCDHFLEEHADKQKELGIDVRKIKTIGKTGAVPTKVFAAHKELDVQLIDRINTALLSLDKNNPEHADILFSAEIGGFQKSMDKDYDSIRALVNEGN